MRNPQDVVLNFPNNQEQTSNSEQSVAQVRPFLSWAQFQEKFKFPITAATRLGTALEAAAADSASSADGHLSAGGLIWGAVAAANYLVSSNIEKRMSGLYEDLQRKAAELSREYNISEEALLDFLNHSPQTLEACLQVGKHYIEAPRIRLSSLLTPNDLREARNHEGEIKSGKEIGIVKTFAGFTVSYRTIFNSEVKRFQSNNEALVALLSPFPFIGQSLPKNPETEALYTYIYKEVGLHGGYQVKYGSSMEEKFAQYLKIRVLLGLDPQELIARKHLCVESADKYVNKEALDYIKKLEVTLQAEEHRKRLMLVYQSALSPLEESSESSALLFSKGQQKQTQSFANIFANIVCDYLHGPSTLEADHAPLKRI